MSDEYDIIDLDFDAKVREARAIVESYWLQRELDLIEEDE